MSNELGYPAGVFATLYKESIKLSTNKKFGDINGPCAT